jgi:hypothetical protein
MNRGDNIAKGISNTFNVSPEQQKFVKDYSSFNPNNTFYEQNSGTYQPEKIRGFNQNINDMSQYNIKNSFKEATPILNNQDFTYKNNTLYANLNSNLLAENIDEYRIDIDASQRNFEVFPNPFEFVVSFGLVNNSGLPTVIPENNIKFDNEEDNKIYSSNPNIIAKYENKLKWVNNPQINQRFKNCKFIRIDNVIVPRFNEVVINECYKWDKCECNKKCKIKDDYDRYYECVLSKNRYIPNVYQCNSLFTERFIMLQIPEIADSKKTGTSTLDTNSYTLFSDKFISLFYYRCSVYYCARTYYDSALGNIDKLSFTFYNSNQEKLTLNTVSINYEAEFIKKTHLLNPQTINFKNEQLYNFYINRLTEIIKCIVLINFDIYKRIPFYETGVDGIVLNDEIFTVSNIFEALNEFVNTEKTFVKVNKITNKGKKVLIGINEYIDNIIWYKPSNCKDKSQIIHNLNVLLIKYKNYVFEILENLKIEIAELPYSKYFMPHIQLVIGVANNELNTKISYHNN